MTSSDALIQDLIDLEPLKTWSVIVTILGDIQQPEISGKDLTAILGTVGIKPEAARVALHRLKKDGWLVSSKNGREVSYKFSDRARAETHAVYEDVYRQDVKFAEGWDLVVVNQDLDPEPGLRIQRNLWLVPTSAKDSLDDPLILPLSDAKTPDWFMAKLTSEASRQASGRLAALARKASQLPLGDAEAIAIRLLCLHHWRKRALRAGTWAEIWLRPSGELANCHKEVTNLLNDLPHIQATQP